MDPLKNGPDVGTATAGEASSLRVWAACLVVSLVALAAPFYANVSPVATLDPWIYTGYFQNFWELVEIYGVRYYVARLPYVVPGALLYAVFTPAIANALLNALLLAGVIAPLWLICRARFGWHVGVVAVAAALAHTYLVSAIAWDYPDGPAIAYTMTGLWLAVARPASLPPRLALVLAGALWSMAGVTNLISGVIIVSSVLTACLWTGDTWRRRAARLLLIGLGAAIGLAAWSAASRAILGTGNVLGPQVEQLLYAVKNEAYLPDMWGRGSAWLATAFRLVPPALLLAAGLLVLSRLRWRPAEEDRPLLATWLGLVVASATFAWAEFGLEKVLLRVAYCSSYLVVPSLLCGAALLHWALRGLAPGAGRTAVAVVLAAVAVLPVFQRAYFPVAPSHIHAWLGALALGSLLVLVRPAWVRAAGGAALAFALGFGSAVDPAVSGLVFRPREAVLMPDSTQSIVSGRAAYQLEVAADLQALIGSGGLRNRPIRFWYDRDEPHLALFDSLYSLYLWGYQDFTAEIPKMTDEQVRQIFVPRTRVLHLTGDKNRIDEHRRLLDSRGIRWREVGAWSLGRRGHRHRVALDEILPAQESSP